MVAEHFSLNPWTLVRWVLRHRETGSVAPLAKRGGQTSPVDVELLETIVLRRWWTSSKPCNSGRAKART